MKLRRIQIENFRGIRELDLDLDDVVVLIGENNTGKTALLHALRLSLRELGPRRRPVFDPFDFHLKDEKAAPSDADAISITVTFGDLEDASQRRLQTILHVDTLDQTRVALQLRCGRDTAGGEFVTTSHFLDAKGQPIPGKGEGDLGAFQQEIAFYLLDALRDAGRNFDARGEFWRPFLKEGQLAPEKRAEIEDRLREVNEFVVASHDTFDRARQRLNSVQDVVPMQGGDVVSIQAVPGRIFDMLSKAQVHLGTMTGAKVPVGRHGEGTQSLAVLMLFAAFLELDAGKPGNTRSPIVALEEPEAHLHPAAVRTLWRTIARVPGQKLISTHSGDLLSQVPVGAVRRLARTTSGLQAFRLKPGTLDDHEQRMFDFHIRHARGELLFARCWLLGEGESELTLFHEISRHLDIDLEREGVRCIPYRLGASIELFLKVARDFGIRWCALTDNDLQGKRDQVHLERHTSPADIRNVHHVMPEEDLESHLCSAGFGAIYEGHLTDQTRTRVTAPSGHPDYWKQVLTAIKNTRGFKPAAVMEVVRRIQKEGAPVPPLLQTAIQKSVEIARGA